MLKGFKEFILRGNVLELAVAVAVGAAFTALVKTITDNLINPIVASIGGSNVNGLAFQLVDGNDKSIIDFGAIITAIITFVITAAVIYFVVVEPMNRLKALEVKRSGRPVGETPQTDIDLLIEIRDLLKEQKNT